jgi:hypothetical protein
MPKETILSGRAQSSRSGFVFGRSLVPVSTQAITIDILYPLFSSVFRYNAGFVLLELRRRKYFHCVVNILTFS